MNKPSSSKLSQRINQLRWQAPVLAFLLVLVHQLLEHTWLWSLSHWQHFATQVLFYGLIGPILAWWALTSLQRQAQDTETAQRSLNQAHLALKDANQRLEFLIQVNRRLAEAEDEEALLEIMVELPQEVVPAVGCSLIRFDERGRPLPLVQQGNLDPVVVEAWMAHLSTSRARQACERCVTHRATDISPCPLLKSLPDELGVSKIHCLSLARGGREYGMLNIYLSGTDQPDSRTHILLATMATEMSLALESQQLRSKELTTLYRLQQARRLSNLRDDLAEVLTHIVEALEADGGALFLNDVNSTELDLLVEVGQALGPSRTLVQGLAQGVQQNGPPVILNDVEQGEDAHIKLSSLLIAPLHSEVQALGSLILWAGQPKAFSRRRIRLVATVAGQMALLIENHQLYLQAEHQAALAERSRLAREIHDGLAQTLGYLKLRSARVANWLASGNLERAQTGLAEVRDLLAEVYVDAREAIDGLRLRPEAGQLNEWLDQALADFQDLSQIRVMSGPPLELELPLEVQTQLLRIIQEALSNIRKHAQATSVRLDWQTDQQWLTLRIIDNGRGFDPDEVPLLSRHGLQIMQERAELLEADFQIISRSGEGTQVLIRLPLNRVQEAGENG